MEKPGYKTTEFLMTMLVNVIAILTMLDVFTPDQQDALLSVVAAVVTALATFGYSISRGLAKKK